MQYWFKTKIPINKKRKKMRFYQKNKKRKERF